MSTQTALDGKVALVTGATGGIGSAVVGSAVVDAIRRNRAIVTPKRAAVVWRAARLSPRAASAMVARAMRSELAATSR
jgi:uncharacterized protein YbjT (DUF2867 family)